MPTVIVQVAVAVLVLSPFVTAKDAVQSGSFVSRSTNVTVAFRMSPEVVSPAASGVTETSCTVVARVTIATETVGEEVDTNVEPA